MLIAKGINSNIFDFKSSRNHSDQPIMEYSSFDQRIERNMLKMDKIMFIIKKTKLILNHYQTLFRDYLDHVNK
jgi:hypothetical protein